MTVSAQVSSWNKSQERISEVNLHWPKINTLEWVAVLMREGLAWRRRRACETVSERESARDTSWVSVK